MSPVDRPSAAKERAEVDAERIAAATSRIHRVRIRLSYSPDGAGPHDRLYPTEIRLEIRLLQEAADLLAADRLPDPAVASPSGTGHEPAADPVVSPAERLESLRFFAAESPDGLAKALTDWMQEVERQVSQLRERLNGLPAHATREPIRW